MKNPNCAYCMQGELVAAFGYPVCEMESGVLYLFREQSHPGRCILAHKKHVSELIDISGDERDQFFADVARASRAIHQAFRPDKVNYGAYGDTGCHLHMHLVPKYKDGFEWGTTFEMNPAKQMLSDEACEELAVKIRQELQKI